VQGGGEESRGMRRNCIVTKQIKLCTNNILSFHSKLPEHDKPKEGKGGERG